MTLAGRDAEDLLGGLRRGEFSPSELLEDVSRRIEELEPDINAFVSLDLDRAIAAAKIADRAYVRGSARPLEGIPLAVKDLIDVEGMVTGAGSSMLSGGPAAAADADVVAAARGAGAIVVGKTMTHEFGWGITTVTPALGATRNPRDPSRIAGGSSGGSAAAVAAGMAPLALGTDTGGSIRIPAAFCGVAGFKPAYGSLSTRGVFPLSASLDHVGPLARTPRDLRLLLSAIVPGGDRAAPIESSKKGLEGVRVGLCPQLFGAAMAPEIEAVWDQTLARVTDLGGELVEVALGEVWRPYEIFAEIQRPEALAAHRSLGLYPERRSEYDEGVLARLEEAAALDPARYLAATAAREVLRARVEALFGRVELLIAPVASCSPPAIGIDSPLHLGQETPLRDLVLPYTVPQNLLGLPACAFPAGIDAEGMPVGVQLTSRAGGEPCLLAAAEALSRPPTS